MRVWLSALVAVAVSLTSLSAVAPAVAEPTAPSITSDQEDYPPGGLVTLTGAGWVPGEVVHIYVNDDQGRSWERDSDVVADEGGAITDVFNLPNWFVATYAVIATGEVSGVARTSFTDSNVQIELAPVGVSATITRNLYSGSTVCSGANTTSTGLAALAVGAGQSVRLDAAATGTVGTSTRAFVDWTSPNSAGFNVIAGTNGRSICVAGAQGNGAAKYSANYAPAPATVETTTVVSSSANPSTYGSPVTFTATVSPSAAAGTVTFRDGTTVLCSAVALVSASAQCNTAALSAGNHSVTASYNGSSTHDPSTSSTLTQVVNAKQLTGSFTADNKVYDGTTAATIATRSLAGGVVGGDIVSLVGGTASFGSKAVGSGKTVTATGFTLTGSSASNYTLASGPWTTSADITTRGVSVSFAAADKTYDGNDSATIASRQLSGVQGSDNLSASGGTATFANKNVGAGKTVSASGFVLGGTDAANYSITSVGTATAAITAKQLIGSFTADNKVYDGTTAATIATRSLTGVISGDIVSLSGGTAAFGSKTVGTGKSVTATGFTLAGTSASNYTLASGPWTTSADITTRGVTVSFSAADKVYDGNDSATISSRQLSGVQGSDDLSVSGGTATFANKNVGGAKTVSASGFVLGGADAGNYSVTVQNTTASISQRDITGAFDSTNKVYDGDSSAAVTNRRLVGHGLG